jgi:hypothetical protein
MAKYNGIIKQSRTLDMAALTGMVGTAVALLPQLQNLMDAKTYGIALVILSVGQAYLRTKTTSPINSKREPE